MPRLAQPFVGPHGLGVTDQRGRAASGFPEVAMQLQVLRKFRPSWSHSVRGFEVAGPAPESPLSPFTIALAPLPTEYLSPAA